MTPNTTPRPDHVPPELVLDFDFREFPGHGVGADDYRVLGLRLGE